MQETTIHAPEAQQLARRMRVMAQIVVPIFSMLIAVTLIGGVYLAIFEPSGEGSAQPDWARALVVLIEAVPASLLVWAVVGAGSLLTEYEKGRFLSKTASAGLKQVGVWALAALVGNIFVVPLLSRALMGEPWLETLRFRPFDLGVLFFAAFILIVGEVIEAAARALKAENDEIV